MQVGRGTRFSMERLHNFLTQDVLGGFFFSFTCLHLTATVDYHAHSGYHCLKGLFPCSN